MDKIVIASFVWLFLTMTENLLVAKIADNHPVAAINIDYCSIALFPTSYIAMFLFFYLRISASKDNQFILEQEKIFEGRKYTPHFNEKKKK